MTNKVSRQARISRMVDYFALFVIGLIGWVCDRVSANRIVQPTGNPHVIG